jgi:hypothetical protein
LQLAVFFDSALEVFQPLVSLKNFTVPLKVTASPVVLGRSFGKDNRNPAQQRQWLASLSPREIRVRGIPAAQSDIRSLARDDLRVFGSESVAGAVLQGPGARESMRQKMPCVKRTRRGFF